jgi:hypothetical protein
MKLLEKIVNRFQELIDFENQLMETRISGSGSNTRSTTARYNRVALITLPYDYVNGEIVTQWGTSCLHILKQVFGSESDHYKNFKELFPDLTNHAVGTKTVKKALGVLKAAKDDYQNSYLFDTRALIEAEIFDDFLEQAEHLLNQGYFTASAVIAGSVLEDSLRKLCTKSEIALSAKPKLDTMNADLAKAGIYNLLKQKQITALADLRNKAAHGQGGFTKEDVEAMIKDVRRFTEDYFS